MTSLRYEQVGGDQIDHLRRSSSFGFLTRLFEEIFIEIQIKFRAHGCSISNSKQRKNVRPWDPRTIDVQVVNTRKVSYINVNRVANVL